MGGMRSMAGLSRRLGGVLLMLAATACGSTTAGVGPDTVAPTPAVTPNACSIVPGAAVAAALSAPAPDELAPASPSPQPATASAATPVPPPWYTVASIGTHSQVGQCTYATSSGPALVVSVVPHATLASVADLTAGSTPLGPAMVQASSKAGLVTVQKGDAVVSIALDLGGVTQDAMTRRLAALAAAVTSQPLSLPSASAGAATAAASPTAAPTPSVAGEQVSGLAAAQTVQETDALKFDPGSVTVSTSGVVQWTNSSSAPHNVTFDANPEITSSTMNPGDKYEVRFTRAGQYPYHCTFHPGMNGTVVVS
jgi:plastocyanin